MLNATENRSESSKPVRILAAALFALMVGSGYAISTHVEAMDDSRMAIPAIPEADQAYFPAQYVNAAQGQMPEELVQNF